VSDVQTSLLSTVVVFQKVWRKLNFVHNGIADTCGQLCVYYVLGGPGETETPTHWNLIGCRMADLPSVLLPSSIFSPPSSHCFFSARKNWAHIPRLLLLQFF